MRPKVTVEDHNFRTAMVQVGSSSKGAGVCSIVYDSRQQKCVMINPYPSAGGSTLYLTKEEACDLNEALSAFLSDVTWQ